MSTEMKTGLVLSGGGAVGAYQAGVVKALAECGTQISMVSGASIGAFNGAIIAASPDLSEAAVRLEALWDHLGNNQVLSVNRLVYFSLLKKLFQAMNLCQIPGRAGALLTTLLHHISTINRFDNLMTQPLLSDGPLTVLMDHYLDTDDLADGLADLERMLMILDGKPVPDNRADVTRRLGDHIHENRHSNHYEDEMFVIKYFQKGTAQIVFKRPELIDKLNNIIARHQSGSTASEMRGE